MVSADIEVSSGASGARDATPQNIMNDKLIFTQTVQTFNAV